MQITSQHGRTSKSPLSFPSELPANKRAGIAPAEMYSQSRFLLQKIMIDASEGRPVSSSTSLSSFSDAPQLWITCTHRQHDRAQLWSAGPISV